MAEALGESSLSKGVNLANQPGFGTRSGGTGQSRNLRGDAARVSGRNSGRGYAGYTNPDNEEFLRQSDLSDAQYHAIRRAGRGGYSNRGILGIDFGKASLEAEKFDNFFGNLECIFA